MRWRLPSTRLIIGAALVMAIMVGLAHLPSSGSPDKDSITQILLQLTRDSDELFDLETSLFKLLTKAQLGELTPSVLRRELDRLDAKRQHLSDRLLRTRFTVLRREQQAIRAGQPGRWRYISIVASRLGSNADILRSLWESLFLPVTMLKDDDANKLREMLLKQQVLSDWAVSRKFLALNQDVANLALSLAIDLGGRR
jgi:hypothetical protein